MLRKTISKFLVLFLSFTLLFSCFSVEAGIVSRVVTIKVVQKILPSLIKNYGKKVGSHAEDVVINYIKKNPKKQQQVFDSIDNYVKKNPLYAQNAAMLKNKITQITPALAKQKITIPKNGKWSGDAGNSNFWPNKVPSKSKHNLDDLQRLVGKDGIKFEKGYPDFTAYRKGHVNVPNMTGEHAKDVSKAAKEFVQNKQFKNKKAAKDYATKHDLAWHHEPDGKTMSLVPRIVHDNVKHHGGADALRSAVKAKKAAARAAKKAAKLKKVP
jgi:hypothetical protein